MEDFQSKYSGEQVEVMLDQIASGEAGGGGGGITVETDPVFSASPAASITEAKKTEWDGKQDAIADLDAIRSGAEKGATALQSVPSEYVTDTELNNKGYATISALNDKVDKVSGKQLSTEDFTSALKTKLEGLNNYDDTELSEALSTLRGDFDKLVSGDTTTAIKTFNEVISFLDGIQDTQDLSSIIASIEQQIAAKQDKITDLDTIRSGAAKGATALQSYTEKYTGTITGIKMNGASKGTSGVVDLGTVITAHQDISGKQDKLVSGTNIKTINGTSILGSGDIVISGGGGGGGSSSGNYPIVYSDSSFPTIEPNTYYILPDDTTYGADFSEELEGVVNEYVIQFTVPEVIIGGSECMLTLPDTVMWANGTIPPLTLGKTYVISIVNNLAVFAEF